MRESEGFIERFRIESFYAPNEWFSKQNPCSRDLLIPNIFEPAAGYLEVKEKGLSICCKSKSSGKKHWVFRENIRIQERSTRYFGEIWGSREEALDILGNLRIKWGDRGGGGSHMAAEGGRKK